MHACDRLFVMVTTETETEASPPPISAWHFWQGDPHVCLCFFDASSFPLLSPLPLGGDCPSTTHAAAEPEKRIHDTWRPAENEKKETREEAMKKGSHHTSLRCRRRRRVPGALGIVCCGVRVGHDGGCRDARARPRLLCITWEDTTWRVPCAAPSSFVSSTLLTLTLAHSSRITQRKSRPA
jgi:hypothetical protein